MTADGYMFLWQDNEEWLERDESGKPTLLPTAPEEAQKSYQYYLQRQEERYMLSYWQSNPDWYEYDEEEDECVLLPSAPEEAKKSYEYYLKRVEEVRNGK